MSGVACVLDLRTFFFHFSNRHFLPPLYTGILTICARAKKTKTEEQFDPHIVAAVEAKLRALGVADDSSQSSLGVEGA